MFIVDQIVETEFGSYLVIGTEICFNNWCVSCTNKTSVLVVHVGGSSDTFRACFPRLLELQREFRIGQLLESAQSMSIEIDLPYLYLSDVSEQHTDKSEYVAETTTARFAEFGCYRYTSGFI